MLIRRNVSARHDGFSMIEVLVTIIILAFGLLGLAAFQMRAQTAELESYQRAQALILLDDMAQRMAANLANAGGYVSSGTFGTGDGYGEPCTDAVGTPARDQCEWSGALKGVAEKKSGANVGAMIDARGCISQVQAANPASGVCTPAVYRIDVVWQGMDPTSVPVVTCGQGAYGDDRQRRAVSRTITVGLPGCY